MPISSARLVLPAGVIITPLKDLPPHLRQRFDHDDGDFCVTRPHSRTVTCVVDEKTAELLRCFRSPTTIVDAVLHLSRSCLIDAQQLLEEAFSALASLAAEGLLVAADSTAAAAVTPTLQPGDRVHGIEIIGCVRILEDTEVYHGRLRNGADVALKVLGRASGYAALAALRHEAHVLKLISGNVGPELLQTADLADRPMLVMTWAAGVDLSTASADARAQPVPYGHDELIGLADELLQAYGRLHELGVLHGDVHPRNVVVGPSGKVIILDYGSANVPDSIGAPVRGGIDIYQAPEVAQSRLETGEIQEPSVASELYSIAALLYLVFTGGQTHLFSLQPDHMLRQVIEDPPLRFEHYGFESPAIERCLRRALAKAPSSRYGSVVEFITDFRRSAATDRSNRRMLSIGRSRPYSLQQLLDTQLDHLSPIGDLYSQGLEPPTASVVHGSSGIAYALLKIAQALEQVDIFATSDLWSALAVSSAADDSAYWNESRGISRDLFGEGSLFLHASGVHYVQSLIAHARDDATTRQQAIDAYVKASKAGAAIDVFFGRAGLLLGCASLLDTLGLPDTQQDLVTLGHELFESIWSELKDEPPIPDGTRLTTLGAAHGWAGILVALLRWSISTGTHPPDGIIDRLSELASLGRPIGRGMVWPRKLGMPIDDPILAASWCNGSAGYVYLWVLASHFWKDAKFDMLARMSGWKAYEGGNAPGSLCCGLAGRAYSLLTLYRHTQEPQWLTRARGLAENAASEPELDMSRRHSLYHGEVGIALLATELNTPDLASMPLFEAQQWPSVAS
jgi:serine/threonine-protein kinase